MERRLNIYSIFEDISKYQTIPSNDWTTPSNVWKYLKMIEYMLKRRSIYNKLNSK